MNKIKTVLITHLFLINAINCMEHTESELKKQHLEGLLCMTLPQLIRNHILHPTPKETRLNINWVLFQFTVEKTRDFRDSKNNNLMHITIKKMIKRNKKGEKIETLLGRCSDIIDHLIHYSVHINALNDDRKTPLALVYEKNDKKKLDPLISYLKARGAQLTCFSLEPELRALKKGFFQLLCCECIKNKKID
jgi:hypothetical protein